MTQIAYFNMEITESLIDLQILYIHVRLGHARLPIFKVGIRVYPCFVVSGGASVQGFPSKARFSVQKKT
jgi:hypothetical protein